MSTEKFQNKYRIETARATWHNYDGGFYHITICTKDRIEYFGTIEKGKSGPEMFLTPIGEYAQEQFENVQTHYPYADIPSFVIMPDHIHAIIHIDGNKCKSNQQTHNDAVPGKDGMYPVSISNNDGMYPVSETMQSISHQKGPLSVVVGGLKRAITKFANDNDIPFAWQTRFHDHIIKNQIQLNETEKYIKRNIAKGYEDKMKNKHQ